MTGPGSAARSGSARARFAGRFPGDGVLELLTARFEDFDGLGVADAQKWLGGNRFEPGDRLLIDAIGKEGHVFPQSFCTVRQRWRMKSSASCMSPSRSQKGTSGSTIQNSARCRAVLEFSARNVGPKV